MSLVGKKERGRWFRTFSHSDTVPGLEGEWDPFDPVIQDGRLFGRGSCDMKGPLAATVAAGAKINAADLKKSLFVVITADEEIGGQGASQVAAESESFNAERPKYGIIAEPTRLTPVYAHKGGGRVLVTAKGRAAHTSTDAGVSAKLPNRTFPRRDGGVGESYSKPMSLS